ncbi:hypothetical protein TgHK011_005358 [Trichoderma gracile]|nr:hypothetical protein TgHK011_005358 [Trichoderma gracile]
MMVRGPAVCLFSAADKFSVPFRPIWWVWCHGESKQNFGVLLLQTEHLSTTFGVRRVENTTIIIVDICCVSCLTAPPALSSERARKVQNAPVPEFQIARRPDSANGETPTGSSVPCATSSKTSSVDRCESRIYILCLGLFDSASLYSTMSSATSFFDFKVPDGTDNEVDLSKYKGKVVLVVNTASKCGFTYQYKNLESVYQAIKKEYPDDFVVLGFPCNQFGSQEPGSNEEIQNFCSLDQKVTFPVMGKINVNGDDAHPLYKWLKKEKPGLLGLERIKWNFEKFLIGRDGKVLGRWASTTEPEKIQDKIIEAIKQPAP